MLSAVYLKPIDGAAVDERRVLAKSRSKGVTDRTEGDDDVEVLPATVDEVRVQFE